MCTGFLKQLGGFVVFRESAVALIDQAYYSIDTSFFWTFSNNVDQAWFFLSKPQVKHCIFWQQEKKNDFIFFIQFSPILVLGF